MEQFRVPFFLPIFPFIPKYVFAFLYPLITVVLLFCPYPRHSFAIYGKYRWVIRPMILLLWYDVAVCFSRKGTHFRPLRARCMCIVQRFVICVVLYWWRTSSNGGRCCEWDEFYSLDHIECSILGRYSIVSFLSYANIRGRGLWRALDGVVALFWSTPPRACYWWKPSKITARHFSYRVSA